MKRGTVARFIAAEELMPIRKTKDSAGYDFIAPKTITIPKGWMVSFDSEVSVEMKSGYVLQLFIRSSLGKKGLTLTNSVGIIDADYRLPINAFLINNGDSDITIEKGDRYMQGIFVQHFIAEEETPTEERIGGIGSTGK